jgi:hypothetical protein
MTISFCCVTTILQKNNYMRTIAHALWIKRTKIFSTLDFQQPKPEKVVTYEVGAKRAA